MAEPFGFGVDLDQLADTTAELARCGRALDGLLAEISRRVEALHDTWSGEAAGAQATAQEAWEAGFRAMRDGLATMRAAGDLAEESYRSAIDTNVRMWGQVV